ITATSGTGTNQLLGGFWSSNSSTSTNKKRTALDQARIQMLQQYFAAVLNFANFSSGTESMLAAARTAYCGTNASAIQDQIGILGVFNSSGDSQLFTPGVAANSKDARTQ